MQLNLYLFGGNLIKLSLHESFRAKIKTLIETSLFVEISKVAMLFSG